MHACMLQRSGFFWDNTLDERRREEFQFFAWEIITGTSHEGRYDAMYCFCLKIFLRSNIILAITSAKKKTNKEKSKGIMQCESYNMCNFVEFLIRIVFSRSHNFFSSILKYKIPILYSMLAQLIAFRLKSEQSSVTNLIIS